MYVKFLGMMTSLLNQVPIMEGLVTPVHVAVQIFHAPIPQAKQFAALFQTVIMDDFLA